MVVGGKITKCKKDTIQRKNSNMKNNNKTFAKMTINSNTSAYMIYLNNYQNIKHRKNK
jgi:hypothetical protein